MKKWLVVIICMSFIFTVGCGNNNENDTTESETTEKVNEETKMTEVDSEMKEPSEETKCAYCEMMVYPKDHDMGVFSAQGITSEGNSLFFDDIGCMLNQERMDKITLEKYVRDYNTDEWIKLEEATIVKAEIKTPMNYGYAFFSTKEEGQTFIDDLGSEKASFSTINDIDEVASHRHMKKMEKMKDGEGMGHDDKENHEGHDMSDEDNEEDNHDSH
ncbi:nitrous oxide reductase accessory protein NosL [Bacillus carboniphilus]|uniref:Nitrous oxide reductase accessory protein NosL n=1 Tax=Bacillus carboniphilus TaxID=86663 RepID=A0ABY9JP93_9BACI|nr:nitrous oxide reductase accessory protein NosL [Bacillus carboniphilus]WLR41227.1 nitrous oxide reductase accessory protein NosL [Bacillus carboniphilus]